jgi:hypothetical protein
MFIQDRRLLSVAAVFVISAVAYLGIGSFPWVLDQFNLVHEPPVECETPPEGSVFCRESFADDGRIQEASFPDKTGNCCVIRRLNLSQQTLSTTERYCAPQGAEPVQCAQAWHHQAPASAVFGDIILTIDLS